MISSYLVKGNMITTYAFNGDGGGVLRRCRDRSALLPAPDSRFGGRCRSYLLARQVPWPGKANEVSVVLLVEHSVSEGMIHGSRCLHHVHVCRSGRLLWCAFPGVGGRRAFREDRLPRVLLVHCAAVGLSEPQGFGRPDGGPGASPGRGVPPSSRSANTSLPIRRRPSRASFFARAAGSRL